MNDLSFMILKVIISMATALITFYLVPYLKSQTGNKETEEIMRAIELAVKAAEQTVKGEKQGKYKKAEAIQFVSSWLKDRGISITDDQIDKLIEAAVYSMKNATAEVVVNARTDSTNTEDDLK